MYLIKEFNPNQLPNETERKQIIEFLYEHLEEYGDPREDIENCLNFALKISESLGGYVLLTLDENNIVGAAIVNKTWMYGYIPGDFLVYLATHKSYRGKGIGKQLLKKTLSMAEGSVKLHVEPKNPARFLYEKLGFSSKYLEMRCYNS